MASSRSPLPRAAAATDFHARSPPRTTTSSPKRAQVDPGGSAGTARTGARCHPPPAHDDHGSLRTTSRSLEMDTIAKHAMRSRLRSPVEGEGAVLGEPPRPRRLLRTVGGATSPPSTRPPSAWSAERPPPPGAREADSSPAEISSRSWCPPRGSAPRRWSQERRAGIRGPATGIACSAVRYFEEGLPRPLERRVHSRGLIRVNMNIAVSST